MAKKQRLSKEELRVENKKLRKQLKSSIYTKEDSERIVHILSRENLVAYALCLFVPPVGIWYIWTRREKLHLNQSSVLLWTFVAVVTGLKYLELLKGLF